MAQLVFVTCKHYINKVHIASCIFTYRACILLLNENLESATTVHFKVSNKSVTQTCSPLWYSRQQPVHPLVFQRLFIPNGLLSKNLFTPGLSRSKPVRPPSTCPVASPKARPSIPHTFLLFCSGPHSNPQSCPQGPGRVSHIRFFCF